MVSKAAWIAMRAMMAFSFFPFPFLFVDGSWVHSERPVGRRGVGHLAAVIFIDWNEMTNRPPTTGGHGPFQFQ